MLFILQIGFVICVGCIQIHTSLDIKNLLYKYVAVCGFDYLCDPNTALLPNMTAVPYKTTNEKTKDSCKHCSCDEHCFRYVIYSTYFVSDKYMAKMSAEVNYLLHVYNSFKN